MEWKVGETDKIYDSLRFKEVYHDFEATGPKLEDLLGRGNDFLKKPEEGQVTNLTNDLKILETKWDNINNGTDDKKIKLEIAQKEVLEFHEALQSCIGWFTNAEKTFGNRKPVSRVIEATLMQTEKHKEFQVEVSSQKETKQKPCCAHAHRTASLGHCVADMLDAMRSSSHFFSF